MTDALWGILKMSEFILEPRAVEKINQYMGICELPSAGLEHICKTELRDMAQKVFDKKSKPLVRLKGECPKESEFDNKQKTYFDNSSSWYQFTWQRGRCGWGSQYWLTAKCENYFEANSERFILNFLSETYGDIETAVAQTECFTELWNGFQRWFDERRKRFMEQTELDIQKWKGICGSAKPQSHGGVANLLKVLTKTMEKQGADIQNIARVQYAVCVQAGIYIPDEFIRDVAVTLDMKEAEGDVDA